ncbi:MAG: hypothetical protein ABEK50_09150, partial [bacterium]
ISLVGSSAGNPVTGMFHQNYSFDWKFTFRDRDRFKSYPVRHHEVRYSLEFDVQRGELRLANLHRYSKTSRPIGAHVMDNQLTRVFLGIMIGLILIGSATWLIHFVASRYTNLRPWEIIIHIPKNKWILVVYLSCVALLFPFGESLHFVLQQSRGAYPPQGDSITIPIMGVFFWAVIGWVLYGFLLWFVLKDHGDRLVIIGWSDNTLWSILWTIPVGIFVFLEFNGLWLEGVMFYYGMDIYEMLPIKILRCLYLVVVIHGALVTHRLIMAKGHLVKK